MKIIYMGTPDFAVAPLEALIENGHEISLVVTQPDKVKGRGREVSFSPVKECALKHNIPVFQPVKIRLEENVEYLRQYPADIFVVAAFGQILSEEILYMPKYGSINIHASLLPKYRGAAPIQWSILNGEKQTGVTIMQMAKGIDDGDILTQKSIEIEPSDTGDSLFDKLMYVGAELIVETLPLIEKGEINPLKQNEEEATHVGKMTKEMGAIDWNWDNAKIERYVRGLNSWPSAYTSFNGKTLKIWGAECVENEESLAPGTIADVTKEYIIVKCGEGALKITELQLEGKKRMSTHDFLLGCKPEKGTVL